MTLKRNKKNQKLKNHLPVLSFFTGGGFLDMGFEQAGFDVIWTNEVNSVVAGMYAYGMSRWRKTINKNAGAVRITNVMDIKRLGGHEIVTQAFPHRNPRCFGIIGGPPCPDFSFGGTNLGGNGTNGRLTKIFINRICYILPPFFVFENVSGLYRTRAHRKFFEKLVRQLERKGYCLDFKILNALESGVPQDRERLIMIGIRKSLVRECAGRKITCSERGWFPWPDNPKYRNARSRFNWPGMTPFGTKPNKPTGIPSELIVDSVLNSRSYPEKAPNGKDMFNAYSQRFSTVKEGDTKRKSFKRLHRYRYSPTVCYGHNEVHLHPWKKRRLSVREAMRIQGIPDEYELPADASLESKFALVSNGVPVPLVHDVAVALRAFLRE